MKKALFTLTPLALAAFAAAQPVTYTELGTISNTSNVYNTPDLSFTSQPAGSQVLWYRFNLAQSTSAGGVFFDIDLHATGATGQADTEISVYSNTGTMIANDDDDGYSLRSALSFGNTTSRPLPADPFFGTTPVAHNGRDGNLVAGTYWLSVSLFDTTFGANWDVVSTATGTPAAVTVNIRTDAVPEPGTMLALAAGIAGIAARRRRKA